MSHNPPDTPTLIGGGWGEPITQIFEALPTWAAILMLVLLIGGAYWLWSRWEHRQMLKRTEERKREEQEPPW